MKTSNEIAEALRDAATAGDDVYSWEFEPESIQVESLSIWRGNVSDLALGGDLDITSIDGEKIRDVVIVNKEVFDEALEALEKLAGPDPILYVHMGALTQQLNNLREALGIPKLVREAPADE
jgi:hypothetical protein